MIVFKGLKYWCWRYRE